MRLNAGLSEHPDHAALIANIIAQWSTIEDAYTRLFSYFIGINFFSACQLFATLRASRAKLDLFDAAGRYFFEGDADALAAFGELVGLLGGRLKDRNKYAHAIYGIDDAGDLVMLRRDRELSQPDKSVEPVRLADLEAAWSASAFTFNTTLRINIILHSKMPDDFLRALHVVWANQSGAVRNRMRAPNADENVTGPEDDYGDSGPEDGHAVP
jgi:hypothetical protein